MTSQERKAVVVIGIGNTMRHDDGVGPLLLDACRYQPLEGCDLVELDGESTRVIDAWTDRELAIVVDAVCTGAKPGTIHDLTIDDVADVQSAPTATSSHFAGLAGAIALGQALDRLPGNLRVLGIEPGDLERGFGLSPAVAASMAKLEAKVRAAARCSTGQAQP